MWPLRADFCTQHPPRQVDVGQPECDERTRGVLGQPTVAHLAEFPQPLDDTEHMLGARANLGLGAVDPTLELLGDAALAHPLVGQVRSVRRLGPDQFLLRGVSAVAVALLFLPVQQLQKYHCWPLRV